MVKFGIDTFTDQLKEMKNSLQEISETSTDLDSDVFGTVSTDLPIPPMLDTTAEAEEVNNLLPCKES